MLSNTCLSLRMMLVRQWSCGTSLLRRDRRGRHASAAAAGRLHVTQPGLSRQLRQLEPELGVDLFDRAGGRLSLSRTGRALLPLAQRPARRADAFRVAATFYAPGRLDQITIGAPTVTLTDVVAPFIATLEPDDPVPRSSRPTPGTRSRRCSAAPTSRSARPPAGSVPLERARGAAGVGVRPADHEWAGRRSVPLGEVLAKPVIVLPPSVTSRQALEAAVAATGATYASWSRRPTAPSRRRSPRPAAGSRSCRTIPGSGWCPSPSTREAAR